MSYKQPVDENNRKNKGQTPQTNKKAIQQHIIAGLRTEIGLRVQFRSQETLICYRHHTIEPFLA